MYKLGLAHEAKPERVAAPSIPIEKSGPQDGTDVGLRGRLVLVASKTAPNIRMARLHPRIQAPQSCQGSVKQRVRKRPRQLPLGSLSTISSTIHNIWSMMLWFKGLSQKWEWFFFTLFITMVLAVGTIGAYLSYLEAVTTILDEAVEVRRYMQRVLEAAGVPRL